MSRAETWSSAFGAWQQARAAEQAYDTTTWGPAVAGDKRALPAIEAEMARLQQARTELEDRMVETPTPTAADLLTKVSIWRDRWDGFEWGDEQWSPILADIARLGKTAAPSELPVSLPAAPTNNDSVEGDR